MAAEPTPRNARWLAPEIIKPSPGTTEMIMESKPADIFAFAMLAVEVFTGKHPFEGLTSSAAACRIFRGKRPEFPQNAEDVGLTVEMWGLIQRCWHPDPAERPTIDDVVREWEGFLGIEHADEYTETPNDQNHEESVSTADRLPDEPRPVSPLAVAEEQPTRPSKYLLPSLYIANSLTR